MKNRINYSHTNLIADDWQKLSEFYIKVFGCKPVFPIRNLKGVWVDKLTQCKDVEIKGIHLKLPGFRKNGPTIEIFEYNKNPDPANPKRINNYGFSHIAFRTDNIHDLLDKVLLNGGQKYGELIVKEIQGVGILTAIYVRDIEGNIIELQNWQVETIKD